MQQQAAALAQVVSVFKVNDTVTAFARSAPSRAVASPSRTALRIASRA